MQRELRERGKLVGSGLFGYDIVGEYKNKSLAPNDVGRAYIPEMFQRIADGESLSDLAVWLNGQNIKTVLWSPKTVSQIIHNRTYAGTRLTAAGQPVLTVEALVDAKLWMRANKRLADAPRGRRGPSKLEPAFLSGVLFCARCKAPMYRIKAWQGWVYRCVGAYPERKGCGNLIPLEATDHLAITMLSQASEPWTELRKIEGENHDVEVAEVRLTIRDLGSQDLPDNEYDARLAELRAERDRLTGLPNTPDRWEPIATGETVGEHFTSLDFDGRRKMLLEDVKFYAEKAPAGIAPGYPLLIMDSRLFQIKQVN